MNVRETGIVHIQDIPYDNIFIKLNWNFQNTITQSLLGKFNTWKQVLKRFNLSGSHYSLLKSTKFVRLSTIIRSLESMNITKLSDLERNITEIKVSKHGKPIVNPKFPIDFNTNEGTGMIAAILGDGGFMNSRWGPQSIWYSNKELLLINRFTRDVAKIIGKVDYKSYEKRGVFITVYPKIVGLIFNAVGIKPGNKLKSNIHIPKFIFNSKNLIRAFLNQIFSDEGYVNKTHRNVGIKLGSLNLLNDIEILLKKLKISTTQIKPSERWWRFSIGGRFNLIKFERLVGFVQDYKKVALKKIIKESRNALKKTEYLLLLAECEKQYGSITSKMMINKTRKSNRTIYSWIWWFRDNGFLRLIKEKYTRNGLKRLYKLTPKAYNVLEGEV